MEHSKNSAKSEGYSDINWPQETGKNSKNQPLRILERTRKRKNKQNSKLVEGKKT